MGKTSLELVDLTEALHLKKVGFDWPTYNFFNPKDSPLEKRGKFKKNYNVDNKMGNCVSRPEIDLAFKWMRDVHGMVTYIYKDNISFSDDKEFRFLFMPFIVDPYGSEVPSFETWEEAAHALLLSNIQFLYFKLNN